MRFRYLKKVFFPFGLMSLVVIAMNGCNQTEGKGVESLLSQTNMVNPEKGKHYVELVLLNHESTDVKILRWLTGVNGLEDDILEVTFNGEAVPYIGPRIKRPAPTEDDFVVLENGRKLFTELDVAKVYDLSRPGEYKVKYKVNMMLNINFLVGNENPPADLSRFTLESNEFSLMVQ